MNRCQSRAERCAGIEADRHRNIGICRNDRLRAGTGFSSDGDMITGCKFCLKADDRKMLRFGFVTAGIDNFDRQERYIERSIELHALPRAPPNGIAAGSAKILTRSADAKAGAKLKTDDRRKRRI